MSDFGLGLRLARERLRGFAPIFVVLLSTVTAFALGVLERRVAPSVAADHSLLGPVFGVGVPLLAYLTLDCVCGGQRLDRSVDALARLGCNRRRAVLGVLFGAVSCLAMVAVLLSTAALLGAYALPNPSLRADLQASAGIALTAGAVYALWFGAASQFGEQGGGRKWALLLDLLLGAGSSVMAAPWPRAHVRNLLGGQAVLGWSQASAWFALFVVALASLAWSASRSAE